MKTGKMSAKGTMHCDTKQPEIYKDNGNQVTFTRILHPMEEFGLDEYFGALHWEMTIKQSPTAETNVGIIISHLKGGIQSPTYDESIRGEMITTVRDSNNHGCVLLEERWDQGKITGLAAKITPHGVGMLKLGPAIATQIAKEISTGDTFALSQQQFKMRATKL